MNKLLKITPTIVFLSNLIVLLAGFFYNPLLVIFLLMSIVSIPIDFVFNTLIINKRCRKNKFLKILINVLMETFVYASLIILIFNGYFDFVEYVMIPIVMITYLLSSLLYFMIDRYHNVKDGIKRSIYEIYPINFKLSLIIFNLIAIIFMLYFRYSQVAFSFSRYKKNFLDIIKIVLFFILVIAIIFGIFLLIDGIITSFKKKKSRIIAGSVSFITEGLLISVISMMTMVGAFCFYPSGYKCEDMQIFFNASQVEIKDDRNYFTGLYRDNGKDKITLFFPGNGMSAKHVMSAFNYYFEDANTNILAVDYPYFGYSKGILSEKTLKKECDMFYEYVTETLGYEKENIIIAGFSIGTFMATYTASTHEASKLVLGAPYNNFTSVLNTYVNVFYPPISNTIEFKFKSDEYARNVKCPVTIVYTLDDYTVPCKLALKLSENFETDVKLIEMEYGGHNGVLMDVHYIEEVMDFIYEGREDIDA